ncbi:hypothetical protein HHX47_DHR2000063 [Lentinula edodes]|nr:hypothetical protein HHX47_DHR2000063 [Lentinula edodes]
MFRLIPSLLESEPCIVGFYKIDSLAGPCQGPKAEGITHVMPTSTPTLHRPCVQCGTWIERHLCGDPHMPPESMRTFLLGSSQTGPFERPTN